MAANMDAQGHGRKCGPAYGYQGNGTHQRNRQCDRLKFCFRTERSFALCTKWNLYSTVPAYRVARLAL
jgi:hypothetical protein